jgi:hypothetical protein
MPLPAFLAAAARLAVLVAAAVTAANAASFARYRRRHLRRIPNPIDESADPIADFRALPSNSAAASAGEDVAGPALFLPPLRPYPSCTCFDCLGLMVLFIVLKRCTGAVVSLVFRQHN